MKVLAIIGGILGLGLAFGTWPVLGWLLLAGVALWIVNEVC